MMAQSSLLRVRVPVASSLRMQPLVRTLFAFLLISAAAAALRSEVVPARPVIPAHRVKLSEFGAVADGRTPNEQAFRRAVAALEKEGGGVLEVTAGRWLTRPFELASRIDLHLDAGAVIAFTTDPADSRVGKNRYRPFLLVKDATDVAISGQGTIDGQGQAWWPDAVRFRDEANRRHARSNTSPRPRLVVFEHCRRIAVEGVTLTRSPVFCLVPVECEDVSVVGVRIFNPADAPNTDGIDPSASRRVLIKGCTIDTGDDCIAVKAGSRSGLRSEDILITDCTFLHGHGCSIGSETYSGVRNMIVQHCRFVGTETGIRMKSDRRRGGLVEHLVYSDITMRDVGHAISISSYYMGTTTDSSGKALADEARPVTATTPQWRDIVIRNLRATACRKSAGLILGLPEMPVEGIVLDHVTIEAPKGMRIAHAKNVRLQDVTFLVKEGPALSVDKTVEGLVTR